MGGECLSRFRSQIPSGSTNPVWAGGVECFAHALGFLSTLWGAGRKDTLAPTGRGAWIQRGSLLETSRVETNYTCW